MRIASRVVMFLLLMELFGQCSPDTSVCTSKMCLVSGSWELEELFFDGEKQGGDLKKFRLILNAPDPEELVSDFARTQISGTNQSGTWSVENNGAVLRLMLDGNPALAEDWLISRFSPRELALVLNRNVSVKEGPAEIKLVLRPL